MYSYIEGTISELSPVNVVIDCQGIGYEMNISLNTFGQIKDKKMCRLFTHLAIKNEATTPTGFVLYGFADPNERSLFRLLISVSGIGSSTAMLMLSSLSPDKLFNAIRENNAGLLQSVKGIGAKSAQRIIIDLKDKLDKGKMSPDFISTSYNTNKDEALSGLTVLGFNKSSADKALEKVVQKLGSDAAVEELIKEALKIL